MDPVSMAMMAVGIGQGVSGLFQKNKANEIANNNLRPEYKVNENVKYNQALSESMAGEGLSDSAKQVYMTGADRGLTNSIDAILKSGGSANQIGGVYDTFLQNQTHASLAEDQARFRNLSILMRNNEAVRDEEDKAFQINKYAPYADKARLASQLGADGNKNLWGGINTLAAGAAGAVQAATNPTEGEPKHPATMDGGGGFTRVNPQTVSPRTMFSAPTMPNLNYTDRSLGIMGGLGVKPITSPSNYWQQPGFVGPQPMGAISPNYGYSEAPQTFSGFIR